MDSAPETWSPMDPRALEQLVHSIASRLQAVEASKQEETTTTDTRLVQVLQQTLRVFGIADIDASNQTAFQLDRLGTDRLEDRRWSSG